MRSLFMVGPFHRFDLGEHLLHPSLSQSTLFSGLLKAQERAKAAKAKAEEKINRGRTLSAQIKSLLAERKSAIAEQKVAFARRLMEIIQQRSTEAKQAADAAQVTEDPVQAEQLAQTAEEKTAEAENALQVLFVEAQTPDQTAAATSPLNQPQPGESTFPIIPVAIGAAAIVGLIALFTGKK